MEQQKDPLDPLPASTAAEVSAIEAEEPAGQRRALVWRQYGAANLRAELTG